MVDKHNKATEPLNQILDELLKCVGDFNSLEVANFKNCKLKADNELYEIERKLKEQKAEQEILLKDNLGSSDNRLIDLLSLQIDSLEAIIQCQDVEINLLKHQIDAYKNAEKISGIADLCGDASYELQKKMTSYQTAKIDKYKKGPIKKSLDSQQKWALANEYLKEQILVHKTLNDARVAAAKKAGIVVELRQLIKKMPDPR